jgi:hypothetical protein
MQSKEFLEEKKEKLTMKTRKFFHFLIFAALVLSACSQAVAASPEPGKTPDAGVEPPAVFTDAETGQEITVKCSRSSDEVQLLVNSALGYCLQYPPEYDIFFPSESEIWLFKRSVLNANEPRVSIKVQPAGEETLEKAADQIAQDHAVPGTEPIRETLTMDGEKAIMLGGLSGQDPNRQVVVQHNDQLYHLFFVEFNNSNPEYEHFETLYNMVIQSFNFSPESNPCPGCPPESDTEADQTLEDPGSAMISGWVWHDLCDSGQDGEPAITTTPDGCVQAVSALGNYHADGLMAINEPHIGGVVVTLGEGICPSTGLAEVTTITTDLSYDFGSLKAGSYCVSIDPQREPNLSILRPGEWTYPDVEQGVISTTVTLYPGEYRGMVNFGWDYQFQP